MNFIVIINFHEFERILSRYFLFTLMFFFFAKGLTVVVHSTAQIKLLHMDSFFYLNLFALF